MADTKLQMIITDFGKAEWAHLVEPDTKFNPVGDFKINLRLPEVLAQPLIDKINAVKEQALLDFQEEAKAEGKTAKAIQKIKLSDIDPFEEDEESEGEYVFRFKRKASYTKDTGEVVNFDVPLVDATGKNIPEAKKPKIGNGSTVRVMADLVPYNMATSGVGVSLRLKKVQIKDLVEFSEDGPAFDACEDGGYVPAGMDESFGSADDGGYTV